MQDFMDYGQNKRPGAGPGMMNPDEDCVPLEALEMPGEDEQMNQPAVGDPVSYHVEGKVTRIEGQNAYVKRETVNGKPLDAEAAKTNDTPDDMDHLAVGPPGGGDGEREQLYQMAQGMGQTGMG